MSKVKTCYNLDLLKQCMERDSPKDVEIPDKLNRDIKIKFTCPCGSEGLCSFRDLYERTMKCRECKKLIGKEKIKQTNLKKIGVENPFQSKEIQEKIKQNNLKNHGAEYHTQTESGKEKIKQSNIKNHGVGNVFQSKEIKDKIKKHFLDTYGVEYPQQVPEFFEKNQKSSLKLKPYTFPSRKEVKIQGYENHALDKLLQTYQEEDLTIGASLVPKIIYTHQQKTKRYYPDIYIPKDNLIIEVKSTYTLKRELEKNLAKRRACIDQGYDFKFWIFHRGKLVQEVNREDLESCILVQSS